MSPLSTIIAKQANELKTANAKVTVFSYLSTLISESALSKLDYETRYSESLGSLPLTPNIRSFLIHFVSVNLHEVNRKTVKEESTRLLIEKLRQLVPTLPTALIQFLEELTWSWNTCATAKAYIWLKVRPTTRKLTPSQAVAFTEFGEDLPVRFEPFFPTLVTLHQHKADTNTLLLLAALLFDKPNNFSRYVKSKNNLFSSSTQLLDCVSTYYTPKYVYTLYGHSDPHILSNLLTKLHLNLLLKLDLNKLQFLPSFDVTNSFIIAFINKESANCRDSIVFSIEQVSQLITLKEALALNKYVASRYLPNFLLKKNNTFVYPLSPSEVVEFITTAISQIGVVKPTISILKGFAERLHNSGVPTETLKTALFSRFHNSYHSLELKHIKHLTLLGLSKNDLMEIFPNIQPSVHYASNLAATNPEELISWLRAGLNPPDLSRAIDDLNHCYYPYILKEVKPFAVNLGLNPSITVALSADYQAQIHTLLSLISYHEGNHPT
jgi:hypothetical protein